jgi:hypothetical protein
MSEHTPGVWFVDKDESDFTVSSEHGQIICCAMSADDFPCLEEGTEDHMDAEARANARLIAAAPDLLAALKALADAHVELYTSEGGRRDTAECLAEMLEARAAISKATKQGSGA